jgi:hypothetical protein
VKTLRNLQAEKCRYAADSLNFQEVDKFPFIADIDRLEAGKFNKMGIIYLP